MYQHGFFSSFFMKIVWFRLIFSFSYFLVPLKLVCLDCLVPLTTVSRRGIPESCLSNKLTRYQLGLYRILIRQDIRPPDIWKKKFYSNFKNLNFLFFSFSFFRFSLNFRLNKNSCHCSHCILPPDIRPDTTNKENRINTLYPFCTVYKCTL